MAKRRMSTFERLEGGLDHLDGTMHNLDDLAKRLIALVEPVEAIVERIDDMVKVGETVMSPLSVTEHAVRGMPKRRTRPSVTVCIARTGAARRRA